METAKKVLFVVVNIGWIFFTYVMLDDRRWSKKKR
jgi:hypothetical protein